MHDSIDERPLPTQPPPLPVVLAEQARRQGQRPLAEFDDRTLSCAALLDESRRIAAGLQRRGVVRGDPVALVLGNRPEILTCLFAVAHLGAVAVPVNVALKGDSLAHVFRVMQPRIAIVEQAFVERVGEALGASAADMQIFVVGGAPGGHGQGFDALLAGDDELVPATVGPGDPWTVLFTSGTTGVAKGVVLPHQQVASAAWDAAHDLGMDADSVFYTFNPLFHLNGLIFGPLAALLAGSRTVVRYAFAREQTLDDLRATGATHWAPVPYLLRGLLAAPPRADDADNALRVVMTFGLTAAEIDAFQTRFGCRLATGYGCTEAGMMCRIQTARPTSSGRVSDRCQMRIVDEHCRDVDPGEVGEILVRARLPYDRMLGYYGMPEATAAAFAGEWFRTGDLARLDEDGYLHFADRAKDSLKRRGENISTFEVERALMSFPGVSAAAVVGYRPGAGAEQEVRAFIEIEPSIVAQEFDFVALIEHCGKHLAYFMVPRFVELARGLPRTALGKIQKQALKDAPLNASTFDAKAAGVDVQR
ncbi:MAG: AMP-binding protein [Gammaproteobacteria bacterium]|nr:AMP-binding protein [Gammaproteobacteria bacterium]